MQKQEERSLQRNHERSRVKKTGSGETEAGHLKPDRSQRRNAGHCGGRKKLELGGELPSTSGLAAGDRNDITEIHFRVNDAHNRDP